MRVRVFPPHCCTLGAVHASEEPAAVAGPLHLRRQFDERGSIDLSIEICFPDVNEEKLLLMLSESPICSRLTEQSALGFEQRSRSVECIALSSSHFTRNQATPDVVVLLVAFVDVDPLGRYGRVPSYVPAVLCLDNFPHRQRVEVVEFLSSGFSHEIGR